MSAFVGAPYRGAFVSPLPPFCSPTTTQSYILRIETVNFVSRNHQNVPRTLHLHQGTLQINYHLLFAFQIANQFSETRRRTRKNILENSKALAFVREFVPTDLLVIVQVELKSESNALYQLEKDTEFVAMTTY